jgi:hypothetical protein
MLDCSASCDKECKSHGEFITKIKILEDKFSVIESNTIVINKLTSKISLLLTIMSFTIVIITGGATYTFTSLNKFKDTYSENRILLQSHLSETQLKNEKFIQKNFKKLEQSIDERLDKVEINIVKLESKIGK